MRARAHSVLALLLASHFAACGAGACQGPPPPPDSGTPPVPASGARPSEAGSGQATTPSSEQPPGERQDPAWARHPRLGQCVPTARDFVEAVAGKQGLTDENIRIRPAAPLSDGSTWVIDQTPQTNYEWYLLQPGEKSDLCLTLHVPVAAQVLLAEGAQGQTADSQTQASPGFPAKAVHFVRPPGERVFHPVTCTEIRFEGDDVARKDVPCAGFFE